MDTLNLFLFVVIQFCVSCVSLKVSPIITAHYENTNWTDVSSLLPERKAGLYHPGKGQPLLFSCSAPFPIQWNITGYLSYRNRIKIPPVTRNLTDNTFTIEAFFALNQHVRLKNGSFSVRFQCEKLDDPSVSSEYYAFIRGDTRTSLVSMSQTNLVDTKLIPCVTFEPDTPTELWRFLDNVTEVQMVDVSFNPTEGFFSETFFQGVFECRQKEFSVRFETVLSKPLNISSEMDSLKTEVMNFQIDNYAGEAHCITEMSPISLQTVRCRHWMHCLFLSPCLRNSSTCNMIAQSTYSSDYETSCRNMKTGNISKCVGLSISHLGGTAECTAGKASGHWNFFISLNYKRYTNWKDATKSELVRMDEVSTVLHTNSTTEFVCEAASFLFANSLSFQIEFRNGSRKLLVNEDNVEIENPTAGHPRAIRDLNVIGVLRMKMPLEAVAVHCLAPWNNQTDVMSIQRDFTVK